VKPSGSYYANRAEKLVELGLQPFRPQPRILDLTGVRFHSTGVRLNLTVVNLDLRVLAGKKSVSKESLGERHVFLFLALATSIAATDLGAFRCHQLSSNAQCWRHPDT
jgi:hypothetical protein